ncbi:MAG TPA: putative sugar nucleotidyl transferase [Candidatus Kapabacteria bacterium]|nr:putative sugar nucleotidyl transferase [Candidatus Kapabacteria bacterium]
MSLHPVAQIVLFEDQNSQSLLFKPLSYTRSIAELRVGFYTALERVQSIAASDAQIVIHSRSYLKDAVAARYPGVKVNSIDPNKDTLFINARLMLTDHLLEQFRTEVNTVFHVEDDQDDLLGVLLNLPITDDLAKKIESGRPISTVDFDLTKRSLPKAKLFTSLWNMVNSNGVVMQTDIRRIIAKGDRKIFKQPRVFPKVGLREEKQIHFEEGCYVAPRAALDATDGHIFIEKGVTIESGAVVMGPAVIRTGTTIRANARIHEGTTIGPTCKIGGEVETSIFQGFANKQHDGFVGHSFIGEWCNLGAGTTTSDLKNDYSNVKVTIEGETIESKALFVGTFMGDHSKTAIGTLLNTGTVIGVSSNVFGYGFQPKWIPNFSWGGAQGIEKYETEKAIEVAKKVMSRRNITLSPADEAMLRSLAK